MTKIAAAFVSLVFTLPAAALTGNETLRLLVERNGEPSIAFIMFVDGLIWGEAGIRINAGVAARAGLGGYLVPFCRPAEANSLQAAQVVLSELRNNPANNHEELAVIARNKLTSVWPCSESQLLSQ